MDVKRAFWQVGRLPQAATAADVNAIVRGNAIDGRGLFVAFLRDELTRRGLEVPLAAHDLIAELEGRTAVSALEKLTSTLDDGVAPDTRPPGTPSAGGALLSH
jgi:hypothetical protein